MGYILHPSSVCAEECGLSGGLCIRTEGELIVEIASTNTSGTEAEHLRLDGLTLLPGFIDIHVHGGNGYDAMDGTYLSINEISLYKIREGVTTFCPSTATAAPERLDAAVRNIKSAMEQGVGGAKIAGSFIEGPYINRAYRGAHEESLIREISLDEIERLVKIGDGSIISFAVSPELENAVEAIKLLRGHGVNVRLGHTAATYGQACRGIDAGGNIAIHTYNAMTPLNHREPGMVGAVLTRDDIYAEIICDFVHVHPAAVKLLCDAKPADKTILITDCMMAGGLEDGEYELGAMAVTVRDGIARTPEGVLAGSTLTIAKAIANLHKELGIGLMELMMMTSAAPAKALGIYNSTGSIRVGKKADFVGIDNDMNVRFVMVDGKIKMMNGELI